MSFESFGSEPVQSEVNEALALIMMKRQEAEAMGANDYEPSAFRRLEGRLLNGEITPKEAVAEAESIVGNKQDYH